MMAEDSVTICASNFAPKLNWASRTLNQDDPLRAHHLDPCSHLISV
jgi:hypothetical protein